MSDTISAQKPQASQKREAASDGKSIASLILGILGITVVPFICSVLAICFGRVSIGNAHKRGERGNATAVIGTILGWIGLITPLVVGLIFSVPWWGIAAALMLTGFAAWGIYDTLRNNPG
jgi:protein-S-isoprenylcysteine O-methyltransferase Ste14